MNRKKLKEVGVNIVTTTAILQSAQNFMQGKLGTLGIPVHEKYPPSFVLKPQKKFPFLKPMRGADYYRQLLEERKRGKR